MPDMRDAIAQYLAYSGGQMPQGGGPQGWMAPRPGIPSNLQGYPQLPSGQFLPTPISDTGPFPGGPPQPRPGTPDADFTGMPPSPQGMPDDTIPPGGLPGMPPVPNTPPVNTPMQGPQIGGMDPNEWYRLYTGGR